LSLVNMSDSPALEAESAAAVAVVPAGSTEAVVPAVAAAEAAEAAADSPWKSVIYRVLTFWVIMQIIRSFTGGKSPAVDPSATPGAASTAANKNQCSNIFKPRENMELFVYWSEDEYFSTFSTDSLLWHDPQLTMGEWYDGDQQDGSRTLSGVLDISETVQNNGSLFFHVYVVKKGYSPDPKSKHYSRYSVVNTTKLMTVYRKQRQHKTKNLLTGTTDNKFEVQNSTDEKLPIISYWHPNLTINILDDHTPWARGGIPSPLDQHIIFDRLENFYYPVLYLNDYWNYATDYMPVNSTTPQLEYSLIYSPISMFKWQLYISQGMRSQWQQYLGDSTASSDQEQDMIKRTLRETNPYVLGLTMIVSLVHSVFEFLAFKNDIQFWKTRKTLEGLSVRSVFFNVFQTLIVLLYVLDHETNMVVVFSCGVGLLIEFWKITKVVDIKKHPTRKWGPFPAITYEDKSSYVESETKVYDRMAFKYLGWALFPLMICYAIYAVLYNEHKGWYSFVLSVAYGFLLMFGFIMMTPQLFINYKMKSVAHLPWRMLTYKALNTFIDDIFAFVIKMPTLYRIGCLRDDVIFFIFLYQKYIYPIDPKRMNEFGTSGEPVVAAISDDPSTTDEQLAITDTIAEEDESTTEALTEEEKKEQ